MNARELITKLTEIVHEDGNHAVVNELGQEIKGLYYDEDDDVVLGCKSFVVLTFKGES